MTEFHCQGCDQDFAVDLTRYDLDKVYPYCPNCGCDKSTKEKEKE